MRWLGPKDVITPPDDRVATGIGNNLGLFGKV